MADDLAGLGSYNIFPLDPDWAQNPKSSFDMVRVVQQYQGTAQSLSSRTDYVPIKFEAGFSIWDRDDEYDLIDFFDTVKARVGAFWLKMPKWAFTTDSKITAGATSFPCYENDASKQYQGFERVYMILNNGDVISRAITTAVNNGAGRVNLNFDGPLSVDIETTDYYRTGRLLLVRFDNDELKVECETDGVFKFNLKFQELPVECAAI